MESLCQGIFQPGTNPRQWLILFIAAALAGTTGCANWSYNSIRVGQSPRDYEKLLPAFDTRRTPLGLCYYKVDSMGREDVIIILVSENRRVAGKLRTEVGTVTKTLGGRRGLTLTGEISGDWLGSEQPGPADTLRYLLTRLAEYHSDKTTMRAHGWVAAGLTRLLELNPQADPITSMPASFSAELERVPSGGSGEAQAADGRILFHYSQPAAN